MVARLSSLRPINRIKHVVDIQQALPKTTQLGVNIVVASDTPALANVTNVLTGSVVHGFFITVETVASETSTTATPNLYIFFAKNPGGNLSFADGNKIGSDDNKKYVIHQEMVMINPTDGGNPRNVFKGVVKIPKHLSRFGPNDSLQMFMFIPSTGVDVNICAQAHYKEFR